MKDFVRKHRREPFCTKGSFRVCFYKLSTPNFVIFIYKAGYLGVLNKFNIKFNYCEQHKLKRYAQYKLNTIRKRRTAKHESL